MLETPRAIENAAAIAAVPGIDSLLIGTNDLAMELGIPGAFGDERIVAAYQSVVDACRAHGKFAGIGGIADRELLRRYIEMGVRLVLPGSDLSLMAAAAAEHALGLGRARPHQDVLRGILLMCAGVSMFPFMNAAVKLLGADYPVAQIVWARFTGHLLVMLLVFLPQYGRRLLATRRPAVQIGRSLLMLVSNMMFVVAITRVPLATASAIGFTSPLIVTALSVPILHESVGIRRWSAVVIGFAGALLVIRPGAGLHDLAVLLLLLSSAAYALYQIATRWVSFYDD